MTLKDNQNSAAKNEAFQRRIHNFSERVPVTGRQLNENYRNWTQRGHASVEGALVYGKSQYSGTPVSNTIRYLTVLLSLLTTHYCIGVIVLDMNK